MESLYKGYYSWSAHRRRDRMKQQKVIYSIYVSLQLRVQNAAPAQPCVGKLGISLVLLDFLDCNFRLWFETT